MHWIYLRQSNNKHSVSKHTKIVLFVLLCIIEPIIGGKILHKKILYFKETVMLNVKSSSSSNEYANQVSNSQPNFKLYSVQISITLVST